MVGWEVRDGPVEAVGSYLLLVAFAFALVWLGVLLGSVVATPEGVTGVGFTLMFPLTFTASTFVPTSTMPSLLRHVAQWNPVTTLSDALRLSFGNPNTPATGSDPWPLQHPLAYSLLWVVGIVVVCAPLSVRAYQRSIAD